MPSHPLAFLPSYLRTFLLSQYELRRKDRLCALQVALHRRAIVDSEVDLPGNFLLARGARLPGPLAVAFHVGVVMFDPMVEHHLQFPEVLGPLW